MSEKLAVGSPAPQFTLPADGNASVSLAQYRGKKLVLYFYPKDDTSGCTQEAIEFNRLRGDFAKAGADILGISADSPESHDKFKSKYDLAFPLASDEKKEMLDAYGVWVERSMYGRKFMGIQRTTVLIDGQGRIAKIWPKVKVPGHAAEVLEAARAL
ncbi:peroxiredoxin [Alsobacter sp. SYSU M60028]|uniref:thioredoxin-dependent peroxiredoxin n=1 Tax=Alsobacter ponti TaxID=2962936 RepID=A0ABT1LH45_9HYPH|nr:peroxiredoxin [Alsobacter ponti]MCP8940281.1 peroxiredoxin [Alsobacter ponti]